MSGPEDPRVRECGEVSRISSELDPAAVADTATCEDPMREPEGIRAVVVNAAIAYDDGRHTGAGSGRMLRYEPSSASYEPSS